MPKEIDAAAKQRTQDVNRVALRMKQYYHGDMDMVQHFVRVYTLAKSIGELEHLSDEEQLDLELAAVVHNVEGDRIPIVRDILRECGIAEAAAMKVCHMVENAENYEHIGTLDHQILIEAKLIVDFKEQNTPEKEIIRKAEDINRGNGMALPEFSGYNGTAHMEPIIKVKAITHRIDPIYQTIIGASEEHVSLAGPAVEAAILDLAEKAMPGKITNVYSHPAGGGKFLAILQVRKIKDTDEGRQRQAAMLAMTAFSELKHVFLVDEDVDIFDMSDVMWAMTTRFQGDVDFIPLPGVHTHVLDPSNDPAFDPSIRVHGIACKAIFDCTVPYTMKDKFERCKFLDVDPKKWLPDFEF